MVGFGAVGQGSLPLILRHIDMKPEQITIVTANEFGKEDRRRIRRQVPRRTAHADNYVAILERVPRPGRFPGQRLVRRVQRRPDRVVPAARRALHRRLHRALARRPHRHLGARRPPLQLRLSRSRAGAAQQVPVRTDLRADARRQPGPGVAPGQAGAAQSRRGPRHEGQRRRSREGWGRLAAQLEVKVIHVSERDHQISQVRKQNGEFVNTWSSEAFCGESLQPAELGWGTHERNWPRDGREYGFGCGAAIYLDRPGRGHARALLGAGRGPVPRLADLARRGDLHPRLPHGARKRQSHLPADLPLRLPSLRRRRAVAAGIRRQRLALSAATSACCATKSTPASTNSACC